MSNRLLALIDADIYQNILKLSPLPDAAKKRSESRENKKVKLSTVLTSSPYKLLFEEKENEKKAKEQKKNLGNKFKKTNQEKIKN